MGCVLVYASAPRTDPPHGEPADGRRSQKLVAAPIGLHHSVHARDILLQPAAVHGPLAVFGEFELLLQLRDAVKDRRPKRITPLLEELAEHTLQPGDAELLERLKPLIGKYRYAEALRLLEDRDHADA